MLFSAYFRVCLELCRSNRSLCIFRCVASAAHFFIAGGSTMLDVKTATTEELREFIRRDIETRTDESDTDLLFEVLDKIILKKLNVTQTSEYIDSIMSPKTKPQRSCKIGEMKLYLNTLNNAVRLIKKSGIKPVTLLQESEGFVEYIIKIPKTS